MLHTLVVARLLILFLMLRFHCFCAFSPGSAIVVAFGPTCTPTYTVDDLGGLFSAASHLVVFILLVLALAWAYCHVRKVEKSFSTYTTVKELHAVHGEKIKHDGPDSDSDPEWVSEWD